MATDPRHSGDFLKIDIIYLILNEYVDLYESWDAVPYIGFHGRNLTLIQFNSYFV